MKRREFLLSIISTLFIVIMMSGTTQAAISPYVGVVIGDEFEYEVTIFHIRQDVNNVNYININPFGMEGNKIKIQVADIVEEETGDFFGLIYVNKTKIKTIEAFAGKSFESGTFLDEWFETFSFLLMYFDFFPSAFIPETYEFYEPEPFNDSAENYEGLPIFASTNASFYQQLNSTFSESALLVPVKNEVERDTPFQLAHETYEVGYWPELNEFYLNVSLYSSNTGTTTSDIGWDLNIGTDIVAHIDTANGLVKDLDYSMHLYIAVGTNSSLMKARQAFQKVEGVERPTITLDYNFIAPTLTILGLVAIIVSRKKLMIKK
ncbi:MAG: hypothetical protein H7641_02480 [Candidatus Heimdallarchaeota archaeon]|nr:hypothetical protein [Candidatus Heimdallarchaeota archaeon]MCK4876430.1 hypothetical protein [Candidatus Heimdallarchaeota archaeon]